MFHVLTSVPPIAGFPAHSRSRGAIGFACATRTRLLLGSVFARLNRNRTDSQCFCIVENGVQATFAGFGARGICRLPDSGVCATDLDCVASDICRVDDDCVARPETWRYLTLPVRRTQRRWPRNPSLETTCGIAVRSRGKFQFPDWIFWLSG